MDEYGFSIVEGDEEFGELEFGLDDGDLSELSALGLLPDALEDDYSEESMP